MRPRQNYALMWLLPIAMLSGCTSHPPDEEQEPTPLQSADAWNPAGDSIQLGCQDGLTDPDSFSDEITLTDTVGSDLRDPRPNLPHANDVGIPAPSKQWQFRKAPLFVAAGSAPVTLSVPDDGQQYLVWTSEDAWTNSENDQIASTWAATELTVTACEEMTTSFFGGLLIDDPTRCFPLQLQEEGHPVETLWIRGDGSTCTS